MSFVPKLDDLPCLYCASSLVLDVLDSNCSSSFVLMLCLPDNVLHIFFSFYVSVSYSGEPSTLILPDLSLLLHTTVDVLFFNFWDNQLYFIISCILAL